MKKSELTSLQAEIKEVAAESRAYNPKIQAASGLERHALRQEKKSLSHPTRMKLLAYGMLRGIPYTVIERKTGCLPYYGALHKEAARFNPAITADECKAWLEKAFEAQPEAAE